MSFQELGDFHAILIVSFHAHMEGFQSTMKEKCVKRRLQKLQYNLQLSHKMQQGLHITTSKIRQNPGTIQAQVKD